jgi:hypothetical protein
MERLRVRTVSVIPRARLVHELYTARARGIRGPWTAGARAAHEEFAKKNTSSFIDKFENKEAVATTRILRTGEG